jgi:hypothetical protein
MKLATLIVTHNDYQTTNLLIENLSNAKNLDIDIFIHVNLKNIEMKEKIIKRKNVFFLHSQEITWSDFSLSRVIIDFLRIIINLEIYNYITVRSGRDFFLDNNFSEKLSSNLIFMKCKEVHKISIDQSRFMIIWNRKFRNKLNNFSLLRLTRSLIMRIFKFGLNISPNKHKVLFSKFFKSTFYFTLPIFAVKHIVEFLDKNPSYIDFFKNSIGPDEFFFSTILANSKYSKLIVDDDLTFISGYKNSSPKTLSPYQVKSLIGTNYEFARKIGSKEIKGYIDLKGKGNL